MASEKLTPARKASLEQTREIASALPFDEAEVFVKEIFKKYPDLVFDQIKSEYSRVRAVMDSLSNIMKGDK